MKLLNSQMSGNAYNKADADTWMTAPKFAQTRKSSFLDVNSLTLYNEGFLKDTETNKDKPINIDELYGNNTNQTS